MKSKKGILLGSILALALSGAGNASVKAAEVDQASAYISKEAADALEMAESVDRIQTPELDLSGLYTVAGSTVVAGIGITSEFDFSEAETEKKQEEPDAASKEAESQAKMTEAAKDSAEASDRTGSTESSKPAETETKAQETKSAETGTKAQETKATETETKAQETKVTETEKKAQETKAAEAGTKAQETKVTETEKKAQETKAAETEKKVQETKVPETEQKVQETKAAETESTTIQELQAEPAVTGDEMDVAPFLLMGAAAGLILAGDLIMKRKAEED